MPSSDYQTILKEAEQLPREERLELIARLADGLREPLPLEPERPRWENYSGTAPSPMCQEDAQDWVTRTRQESDKERPLP